MLIGGGFIAIGVDASLTLIIDAILGLLSEEKQKFFTELYTEQQAGASKSNDRDEDENRKLRRQVL